MITFLIASGLLAGWVLSLLVRPFGKCFACRGRGVRIRKGSRRARKCRLCQGRRRRQRTGSRTVHRVRRQVTAHWREPR
jgi:hypothetical protein